jgi:cleavage and polyadenylation specificity factor subunit 2
LSYPDPGHLGAFPYLVGKLGLNCPIYSTIPVYKMGQLFMYDSFMSHYNQHDFDLFTLDDVDAAFERITQLKYNQSVSLKGKGYGITIIPLPAGRMIGGTIWKIAKIGEEDIVYATDFNHKKERHLNGCELEKLQRPSLLICDSFNAKYQQARRRARDEKLMTNILQTLRSNGNVLVAVDAAGRVLELSHMLDQLWRNKEYGLNAYSLAVLSNVSYNVVEFAKSQIEWMSDKLMKSFEGARNNPFHFRHAKLVHSIADLMKIPGPKVVLASSPDLESGFSRELFMQWSQSPTNSIILTQRTSYGTLARDLIENGGNRKIELEVKKRVELEGAELEEFMRIEGEKHRPSNILIRDKEEDLSSEDSEDEDIEMKVITGKHDIVVRSEGRTHSGFFKSSKKQFAMFPLYEERIKFDEYGEIIQVEDYRIADMGMDAQDDNKENQLLKQEDMKKEKDEEISSIEKPTKCIVQRKLIDIKAQVQFIDFEGRSDGESLMKLLSQLRPRRVVVVHGSESSSQLIAQHCEQNIGSKVFIPRQNEVIDATTETHIYQVRLTEALVSDLEFQKGKDAEIAWINGKISIRKKIIDNVTAMDEDIQLEITNDDSNKIIALDPLPADEIPAHNFVFLNELKLADFRQILMKNNIQSEISGGMLLCCNGTIALKRMDTGKVTLEGALSEDYYTVRELLYEQYAIV